jgi:hypothetical protein
MSTTTTVIIIVGVLIVAAILVWHFLQERRTIQLRRHFGPEYDRAVREFGGQHKAENALVARQRRMEKIHVRPLTPTERDRFADEWHDVQARFVDDPPGSIRDADRLVMEVMRVRGYPMGEFEQCAEDLSVNHPRVVRNYRAAHAVALRREKGEASTEDLRVALVYYRELFDDLLGVPETVGANREDRK